MRLPEVRSALHVLASDIEARGMEAEARKLRSLAEKTKRRPAVRRASPRARAVTPDLEERIRQTATAHTAWSLHEIDIACGVNQGRVSEILAGSAAFQHRRHNRALYAKDCSPVAKSRQEASILLFEAKA